MIVTCPSCSSKFRVRDEAVPPEGAQLKCASCDQLFVARPPRPVDDDLAKMVETLRGQKSAADSRIADLETIVESMRTELEKRKAEALTLGETQTDFVTQMQAAERKVELALAAAEKSRHEADELRARLAQVQDGDIKTMQNDLQILQTALADTTTERDRLKAQLSLAPASTSVQAIPPSLLGALNAVGPMTWGLKRAIAYIEPFAPNQPALEDHLQQLRLLHTMLERLIAEADGVTN